MIDLTRIWILVCGAAAVAVLAIGWFVGVQPQLTAADASNASATQIDAQNQQTGIRLAALTKVAATSAAMKAKNDVLQLAMPSILKPNRFIRRVNQVAALDGVTVASVNLGDAIPYAEPPSAAGGAAAAGITTTPLAKTSPLITSANLALVPANIVVSAGSDAVTQFAHDIQDDQRTYDVTGLQLSKDETSSTVTGTLTGFIYVLKR